MPNQLFNTQSIVWAGCLIAGSARAQFQPAAPTGMVQTTVTVATGDLGGKFYGSPTDPARTRRYYIAAEPELWNYAPEGRDVICGKPLPPAVTDRPSGVKLRYVQYTDETFQKKVIPTSRLGVLGPVLRGVVGDFLAVTFLNRTAQPLSMHPHGVKYDKDSEGSYYQPKPGRGAAVAPDAKFTYVWQLDESSGPLPGEPSSKGWLYHSHVNGDEEADLGLVGFIIVADPKRARPDGTPHDVDREMASLFMIFDESGLGAAEKEAAEYAKGLGGGPPKKTWAQVQELIEQGNRYAINGYIFGNLPGLEMNEGERVRWYLFALGSEQDFHTAHWHGLRVTEENRRRTDVVELLPASMKVADMIADNPGSWLFHCHVTEHMMEGMFARVIVHPKPAQSASRTLEPAFFGLRPAEQSLQIKRAEAVLDFSPRAAQPCELKLDGTVTVYNGFLVSRQTFRFQIGGKSITLETGAQGMARADGASLRVKNASPYGVVYGDLLDFELTLTGADWLREWERLGLTTQPVPETMAALPVPVILEVNAVRHSTSAVIACRKVTAMTPASTPPKKN